MGMRVFFVMMMVIVVVMVMVVVMVIMMVVVVVVMMVVRINSVRDQMQERITKETSGSKTQENFEERCVLRGVI
jgi:type IV secretory pathway VirB3-like protein